MIAVRINRTWSVYALFHIPLIYILFIRWPFQAPRRLMVALVNCLNTIAQTCGNIVNVLLKRKYKKCCDKGNFDVKADPHSAVKTLEKLMKFMKINISLYICGTILWSQNCFGSFTQSLQKHRIELIAAETQINRTIYDTWHKVKIGDNLKRKRSWIGNN